MEQRLFLKALELAATRYTITSSVYNIMCVYMYIYAFHRFPNQQYLKTWFRQLVNLESVTRDLVAVSTHQLPKNQQVKSGDMVQRTKGNVDLVHNTAQLLSLQRKPHQGQGRGGGRKKKWQRQKARHTSEGAPTHKTICWLCSFV